MDTEFKNMVFLLSNQSASSIKMRLLSRNPVEEKTEKPDKFIAIATDRLNAVKQNRHTDFRKNLPFKQKNLN